jgi:hypothetical protein
MTERRFLIGIEAQSKGMVVGVKGSFRMAKAGFDFMFCTLILFASNRN